MRFKTLLFTAFVCFLVTAAQAELRTFSLLGPEDSSLFETDLIYTVLKLEGTGVDTVTVALNGQVVATLPAAKAMLCIPLRLEPGPNKIKLTALLNGEMVRTKDVSVFFRTDLSDLYKTAPEGFTPIPFHAGNKEKECLPCHRVEVSESDMKPAAPSDSVCYSCHKAITSSGFAHGPSARWACLVCHDPKSGPQKYTVKKPISIVCFECHKDNKSLWDSRPFTHKPFAAGRCTICHNPHSAGTNELLKKKSWDLCVSCHTNRATGGHVGAGFSGSVHPTKGRPDPAQPGRELSCASCHEPHAASEKRLFAYNASGTSRLCKVCHKPD